MKDNEQGTIINLQGIDEMGNFPNTPPPGDMTRKHRMKRLEKTLVSQGLYVRPVPLDESASEWGYFIVSVDNPYEAARHHGQDQG